MFLRYLVDNYTIPKTPVFEQQKCMIYRNRKFSCSICLENCPVEAINIINSTVTVDQDRCTDCGFCTTLCPSHSFSPTSFNAKTLIKDAVSREEVVLGCSQTPTVFEKIQIPCVSFLDWEILAALLLARGYKPLQVDISPCLKCDKKHLKLFISSARECYRRLGIRSGNLIKVITPLNKKTHVCFSRRDIFKLFVKEVYKTTSDLASGFISNIDESSSHRQLLRSVFNVSSGIKIILPFKKANDFCSGCKICEGICPQGAWQLTTLEKRARLIFNPWNCTECGLCEFSCPNKAIQRSTITIAPESNEKHVVKEFEIKKCRNCSRTLIQRPDQNESLCQVCKKRKSYL